MTRPLLYTLKLGVHISIATTMHTVSSFKTCYNFKHIASANEIGHADNDLKREKIPYVTHGTDVTDICYS